MKIVILKECSDGNESVGNEWIESKIFEESDTLAKVLGWVNGIHGQPHRGRVMITVAHEYPKP
jgi:hypothetical protein